MKKLLGFLATLFLATKVYACIPDVTSPPVLVQFNSLLIEQQYEGKKTQAAVKTLLDIGEDGRVKNYHIISTEPVDLSMHQVKSAIKKARFSPPSNHGNPVAVKDYIYTFEFEVGE